MEYISLILNILFGGGFITTLLMLRTQKRQAMAGVRANEIDNLDRVAKIWRESLEAREKYFEDEVGKLFSRIKEMEATIQKLTRTNQQILKLLKEINHENLEQKKEEASTLAGNQA
jgi:hypothetical protein